MTKRRLSRVGGCASVSINLADSATFVCVLTPYETVTLSSVGVHSHLGGRPNRYPCKRSSPRNCPGIARNQLGLLLPPTEESNKLTPLRRVYCVFKQITTLPIHSPIHIPNTVYPSPSRSHPMASPPPTSTHTHPIPNANAKRRHTKRGTIVHPKCAMGGHHTESVVVEATSTSTSTLFDNRVDPA